MWYISTEEVQSKFKSITYPNLKLNNWKGFPENDILVLYAVFETVVEPELKLIVIVGYTYGDALYIVSEYSSYTIKLLSPKKYILSK